MSTHTIHEALGKPVLFKYSPEERNADTLEYQLYFANRDSRKHAETAIFNLYPHETLTLPHAPHTINNRPYYTIKLSTELGERIEKATPESHQIHEVLQRGGVRTESTPIGSASSEKLEKALDIGISAALRA